jgi:hypothetical protein
MLAYIDPHGQLKVRQIPYVEFTENMPNYFASNLSTGKELRISQNVHESDLDSFFGPHSPLTGRINSEYEGTPKQMFKYGESVILLSGKNCLLEHDFSGTIIRLSLRGIPFALWDAILQGSKLDDLLADWPLMEDWLWLAQQSEETIMSSQNPENPLLCISLPSDGHCEVNMIFKDKQLIELTMIG